MKVSKHKKQEILIIGIGNTGRSDDGLGWKMADCLDNLALDHVTVVYRYQLQVEDAHLIGEFPTVIFADASKEKLPGGFAWRTCKPADHYFYSSHLQSPETVLYLAETLYNKSPESYTLAIAGENWDLGETLSENASQNFRQALSFLLSRVENNFNNTQPIQLQTVTPEGEA